MRRRLGRAFWLGAAAILIVAALVAIAALVRGELTETDGEILATLGALFLAGAAGLAGLALVDAGRFTGAGWIAAGAAPPQFGVLVFWIWSDFSGEALGKIGLSVILVLIGELAVLTHLLIVSNRRLEVLVWATAALALTAITLTIGAIWTEPDSESFVKVLAVVWILAGLGWFLLPVLQRYTAAGLSSGDRVLAELDGVELIATRSTAGMPVEARLARGEHLALRRRA